MRIKGKQRAFTLIELMIVVAIIGALAALALAAYNDYVIRSRVSSAVALGSAAKASVADYRISKGVMPSTTTQAGVATTTTNYVSSIAVAAGGVITITGNSTNLGTGGAIAIVLTPTYANDAVTWTCTATGQSQYAPASCR